MLSADRAERWTLNCRRPGRVLPRLLTIAAVTRPSGDSSETPFRHALRPKPSKCLRQFRARFAILERKPMEKPISGKVVAQHNSRESCWIIVHGMSTLKRGSCHVDDLSQAKFTMLRISWTVFGALFDLPQLSHMCFSAIPFRASW